MKDNSFSTDNLKFYLVDKDGKAIEVDQEEIFKTLTFSSKKPGEDVKQELTPNQK
jgi:hypothetical protein